MLLIIYPNLPTNEKRSLCTVLVRHDIWYVERNEKQDIRPYGCNVCRACFCCVLFFLIEMTDQPFMSARERVASFNHFDVSSEFRHLKNMMGKVMGKVYQGKKQETQFGATEGSEEFVVSIVQVVFRELSPYIIQNVMRSCGGKAFVNNADDLKTRKTISSEDILYALRMVLSPTALLLAQPLGQFLSKYIQRKKKDGDEADEDDVEEEEDDHSVGCLTPIAVWRRVLSTCGVPRISAHAVKVLRAAMEWLVQVVVQNGATYAANNRESSKKSNRWILTPYDLVGGMKKDKFLTEILHRMALPASFASIFVEYTAEKLRINEDDMEAEYQKYQQEKLSEKQREREEQRMIREKVDEAIKVKEEKQRVRKEKAKERRLEKKKLEAVTEYAHPRNKRPVVVVEESSSEDEAPPPKKAPKRTSPPTEGVVEKRAKNKTTSVSSSIEAPVVELQKKKKKKKVDSSIEAPVVLASPSLLKKKNKQKNKVVE